MGMPRDQQQRITLKRVDDHQRRFTIANARRLIYELNYAVDSKSLVRFLHAESWVPTLVSCFSLAILKACTYLRFRILSPIGSIPWASTFTPC